jgi:hypothetical protein
MSRDPITFSGSRVIDGQVTDFADLLNPENWKVNVPLLWQESGLVTGQVLPADRDDDPEVTPSTGPWSARKLFFENVTFGFVSSQRNILYTTYTKTPTANPTQVEFKYWQYECLSSVFMGEENMGGIDVDAGGATCVALPPNQVQLDISKNVRFTQPADELPLVDFVTSIAVQFVMDILLYGIVAPNQNGE